MYKSHQLQGMGHFVSAPLLAAQFAFLQANSRDHCSTKRDIHFKTGVAKVARFAALLAGAVRLPSTQIINQE